MTFCRAALLGLASLAAAVVSGCGGGSGGSSTVAGGGTGTGSSGSTGYTAGEFKPESTFDQKCAAPRSGTTDTQGTTTDENNWLRSWTNDLYLWYSEVPDINPASYSSTADYFALLKTSATTASGAKKDKFHFTYATDVWKALSESGQSAGYGAQFSLISSSPPRQVVVAYTEPNSPATSQSAHLARGAQIMTVDGVDVVNSNDVTTLNNGLFPDAAGATHTFGVKDLGSSTIRNVTLMSATITSTPVQHVSTFNLNGGVVGYMLFNDHLGTSEQELVTGFQYLKDHGATDLVLDIRYNGGGYLDIASEVAYMIAGTATAGKNFETTQFNSKHPTTDPVTGQTITPVPFHSTGQNFTVSQTTMLPTLNLHKVYILAGPDTCSASESIINSLRGIDVQVVLIGHTTCGKPYGFYPQDNCGTTYFSIQFRGVNNKNFGDYTDGFTPGTETTANAAIVAGCQVADNFTHDLGDPLEGRFAAALQYRTAQSCPAVSVSPGSLSKAKEQVNPLAAVAEPVTPKSPWQENRILRH